MRNELNDLGIIKQFNGMDVQQTRHFFKLSCETYIDKIISHRKCQHKHYGNKPIPMRHDSSYVATLELMEGRNNPTKHSWLEHDMGFNYCQVIGEAIFCHDSLQN